LVLLALLHRRAETGIVRPQALARAALDALGDAAALPEGRIRHVDALLAHAACELERPVLELLLLLRGQLGRADPLEDLPAGLFRPVHRRLVGSKVRPCDLDPAALARLGVGHVHAVLAHALREVEHCLARLGALVAGARGGIGIAAAAGAQGKRGCGERQGQDCESVVGHSAIQGAPAERPVRGG
jgi:hypothetical protein